MKQRTSQDHHQEGPSRREIADGCREIQERWSDTERRKRAGMPRFEPWNPPMIPGYQFDCDFESESV
jgi:hypothetical protein